MENTKEEWKEEFIKKFVQVLPGVMPFVAFMDAETGKYDYWNDYVLINFIRDVVSKEKSRIQEEIEKMKIPTMSVGIIGNSSEITDLTYNGISQKDWEGYNKCLEDIKEILR